MPEQLRCRLLGLTDGASHSHELLADAIRLQRTCVRPKFPSHDQPFLPSDRLPSFGLLGGNTLGQFEFKTILIGLRQHRSLSVGKSTSQKHRPLTTSSDHDLQDVSQFLSNGNLSLAPGLYLPTEFGFVPHKQETLFQIQVIR